MIENKYSVENTILNSGYDREYPELIVPDVTAFLNTWANGATDIKSACRFRYTHDDQVQLSLSEIPPELCTNLQESLAEVLIQHCLYTPLHGMPLIRVYQGVTDQQQFQLLYEIIEGLGLPELNTLSSTKEVYSRNLGSYTVDRSPLHDMELWDKEALLKTYQQQGLNLLPNETNLGEQIRINALHDYLNPARLQRIFTSIPGYSPKKIDLQLIGTVGTYSCFRPQISIVYQEFITKVKSMFPNIDMPDNAESMTIAQFRQVPHRSLITFPDEQMSIDVGFYTTSGYCNDHSERTH